MEHDEPQVGPYRLLRHLATGGMADVWLARHEGPEGFQKEVVIKRIRGLRSGDDEFRTMFLDEARLTAMLSHPNIVQVHELGEEGGEFYVAMEYVEGCDLEAVIRRDGTLDWAVAAFIVEQILLALIYANELEYDGERLDVVHRDISPSNILLSRSGHVKLADFGVAKALSNHHKTQTGATKGKLSYMSPEQVRADQLDCRSDLFALGINLYEMLTGELPFGDGVRALHAIQAEPHPPIDGASIPDDLKRLIDKALSKDPADRFESPEQMHDALIGVMRGSSAHVVRRDIAELVVSGPVAATVAAVPSAQPTTAEVAAPTEPVSAGASTEVIRSSTRAETAVVGPRSDDLQDQRRPARLPWILIGVLFGMLIAGAASTAAFMVAYDDAEDETDTVASEPAETSGTDGETGGETAGQPGDKPATGKDRRRGKDSEKARDDRRKRAKDKKDDDEDDDEAERERDDRRDDADKKAKKKLERERKKREREIKKRLEREKKRLEREAKKWKL